MKCVACDTEMDRHVRHGVTIDHCPACGGVWLDKGELDHLIAAVRPAVTLANPDPPQKRPERSSSEDLPSKGQRPDPAPPRARSESARSGRPANGQRDDPAPSEAPSRAKRAQRGASHRYRGRYSKKDSLEDRLEDILEEIFDFD